MLKVAGEIPIGRLGIEPLFGRSRLCGNSHPNCVDRVVPCGSTHASLGDWTDPVVWPGVGTDSGGMRRRVRDSTRKAGQGSPAFLVIYLPAGRHSPRLTRR